MKPYEQLMPLLASGDLDAQINSLTLINVLLGKATDNFTKKQLVVGLVNVGITDVLEVGAFLRLYTS